MINWINKKRNKKGFTLIELVVVIAILGILAALAIPRLTGARDNAEKTTVEANLRTIDGAISMNEAEGNTAPANIGALVTNGLLGAEPEEPTGVTYGLLEVNGELRAVVTIVANTFGTHTLKTTLTVEGLRAETDW